MATNLDQLSGLPPVNTSSTPPSVLGATKDQGAATGDTTGGDNAGLGFDFNSIIKQYGLTPFSDSASAVGAFADTYQQLHDKLGLTDIKSEYDKISKDYQANQDELAAEIAKVNENPWLPEGNRQKRIDALTQKYSSKGDNLTRRLTLLDNLYTRGQQEAQFITQQTLQERQRGQDLNKDLVLKAIDLAEKRATNLNDLSKNSNDLNSKLLLEVAKAGGNPALVDFSLPYQTNVINVSKTLANANTQDQFIKNIQIALGIANLTGDPTIVENLLTNVPGGTPGGTVPAGGATSAIPGAAIPSTNALANYLNTVTNALHVDPSTQLYQLQGKETQLAAAIQMAEGYNPGTVSYRNNNPGNIVFAGVSYPGMVGTESVTGPDGKTRPFVKFDTYQNGFKAMVADITNKLRGKTTTGLTPTSTLKDLVSTWVNGTQATLASKTTTSAAQQPQFSPSGSAVIDSWVKSVVNGTKTIKEVPEKLWPKVQSILEAGGFDVTSTIDLETAKKYAEDAKKPISKEEAQALGLPFGTTFEQAAGKIPLSDTQRAALGGFGNAFSLLDQFTKYSSKINTETAYGNALKKGAQLSIDSRTGKNTDAATYLSKGAEMVQIVRQLGDKGNIPQQQVEKAIKLVPSFYDTKAIADQKLSDLRSYFRDAFKGLLGALTTPITSSDIEGIKAGTTTPEQFLSGQGGAPAGGKTYQGFKLPN